MRAARGVLMAEQPSDAQIGEPRGKRIACSRAAAFGGTHERAERGEMSIDLEDFEIIVMPWIVYAGFLGYGGRLRAERLVRQASDDAV
jgi:hypothetical protein